MEALVSIIIPTYNRSYLISETLNSIIEQSYTNWECIVIDDGSTDNTERLLLDYCKKDKRIHYYQRPIHITKGANSCRNYGFDISKGEYIKWFDSDDIMLPGHIEILLRSLQKENVDFAVGDCIHFEVGKVNNIKIYDFDRSKAKMDAFMFATNQIGWITYDFLGKRKILEDIKFNEKLIDGQEYNFFIKLLLQNQKGIFVNEVLTKARLHSQSLSAINQQDALNHKKIIAEIKILTLEDIYKYNHYELNSWFLSGYVQYTYTLAQNKCKPPYLLKGFLSIIKVKNSLKAIIFIMSLILVFLFGKGYRLNKFSRS